MALSLCKCWMTKSKRCKRSLASIAGSTTVAGPPSDTIEAIDSTASFSVEVVVVVLLLLFGGGQPPRLLFEVTRLVLGSWSAMLNDQE